MSNEYGTERIQSSLLLMGAVKGGEEAAVVIRNSHATCGDVLVHPGHGQRVEVTCENHRVVLPRAEGSPQLIEQVVRLHQFDLRLLGIPEEVGVCDNKLRARNLNLIGNSASKAESK